MSFEYNIKEPSLNDRISDLRRYSKTDSASFAKEDITQAFDGLNEKGTSGDNNGFLNELYLIQVKYVALCDKWGNPIINPPVIKEE